MAKELSTRTAETIIEESKEKEPQKPVPTGFNATTVERDLAQARSKVQMLNNSINRLNQELGEIRQELEVANKIHQLLEAAKGQVMEIDRLKEKQNGNSS